MDEWKGREGSGLIVFSFLFFPPNISLPIPIRIPFSPPPAFALLSFSGIPTLFLLLFLRALPFHFPALLCSACFVWVNVVRVSE